MAELGKNGSKTVFSGHSLCKKIIFLQMSLFCALSCSVAIATRPHYLTLSSSHDGLKSGRPKQSLRNDFLVNGSGSKSNFEDSLNGGMHGNLKNLTDKKHGKGFDEKGARLRGIILGNLSDGSRKVELKRRLFYLLLAQQEAKCLEELGDLEPTVRSEFPQNPLRPYVCLTGSQNFSACEQCIQIVGGVRMGQDIVSQATSCQFVCLPSPALPHCTERCEEVVLSLINGTTRVQNASFPGQGAKGGCNQNECKLSAVAPEVRGRHYATSSGRVKFSNVTLTTTVFCESVTQPAKSAAKSRPTRRCTDAHCLHFVYLKSILVGTGDGSFAQKSGIPAVIFVVEQRELVPHAGGPKRRVQKGKWTGWRTLGKSPNNGFDKIQVEYRQQTYQWRVTAVGVRGLLAVSTINSFTTLDGYMRAGPPRRVFVVENQAKESTVDVLLGWDPPGERACFYKILLEARMGEEPSRTVRIKGEPAGVHKVWFRDLKFDCLYHVRITSRSAEWHGDESTHASFSFTTPACLDAHQFRFDKCAPPPPRNLSFNVKPPGSPSRVHDTSVDAGTTSVRYFTAQLMWMPPAHATRTNAVEKYVVDIGPLPPPTRRSKTDGLKAARSSSELADPTQHRMTPRRLHLPGNVTQVSVDNLEEAAEYAVLVTAVTSKGSSPPAALTTLIQLHSEAATLKKTRSLGMYLCSMFLAIWIVALVGCHAVKGIRLRGRMRATLDPQFQPIDQQNAPALDCSMKSSLTEDAAISTWKYLEENYGYAKDKWGVGFEEMTLGDVIGQGAFGVVRQATIKRQRYLELQTNHDNKTSDNEYPPGGQLGKDQTGAGVERVALKMLRATVTKADMGDFITELKIMLSLGIHPQIVTMLGVCQKSPKSMYLILEHCPGGDLLSFLRKYRRRHLPMLNLYSSRNVKGAQWEDPAASRANAHAHDNDLMGRNLSESREHPLEQVCYTELAQHKTCSSTLECFQQEKEEDANQEADTDTQAGTPVEENSELELISEEDVLSYAHQIALGMAYLERSHIVHRDLACRNVLVMGNHKRVKISDFGMSRDIYTGNVYQQLTPRKVPIKWMALESITHGMYTSKSDVWSYGIVLWELVTLGAVPYPGVENEEILKLLCADYRMKRPDNCSRELYALMGKCWRKGRVDRPNSTELISWLETMMETGPELYLTLQPAA